MYAMKYLKVILFSMIACFEPHLIYGERDLGAFINPLKYDADFRSLIYGPRWL